MRSLKPVFYRSCFYFLGTKEYLEWDFQIAGLLAAIFLFFAAYGYSTGDVVLKRNFLDKGLKDAEKLRKEEEELYEKSVALAKLRMEEIPSKTTRQN